MPGSPPGRTTRAGLLVGGYLQTAWHLLLGTQAAQLDAVNAVGGLAVTPTAVASDAVTPTGLGVTVAPGVYKTLAGGAGGTVSYPGDTATLAASSTVYLWLDTVPSLQTGVGWPSGEHVRLAVVTTGSTAVTGVTDWRVVFQSSNGP